MTTSGRLWMLATRYFRDWYTVVGEVPWSSVPKTKMNCHSKLVLYLLRNNQPVQVVMHQPRQTTLVFLGLYNQTFFNILSKTLFGEEDNRVATVNARCDKDMD